MTVFVDMDGVLSDFFGQAMRVHESDGVDYPKGQYRIEEYLGISASEFWAKIDHEGEEFWSEMPLCEGAMDLWDTLQPLKPIILTSPSMQPHCVSGKLKWMQDWFGTSFRDYIFCPANHKYKLARHNSFLIDDSQSNCNDWIEKGDSPLGCTLWPHIGNSRESSIEDAMGSMKSVLGLDHGG